MNQSYDITGALSLNRFRQPAITPTSHLSVFELRKILFLFVFVASGLGIAGFYGAKQLIQSIHGRDELLSAQADQIKEAERLIAQAQADIEDLKQLNVRTISNTLQLAKRIQLVIDTGHTGEREFLQFMVPEALKLQITHKIPASATVAMACYESNYGRSDLAKQLNNLFGIKALDPNWNGVKVSMPTKDNGVKTQAMFRGYNAWSDCVVGYADFLKSSDKYQLAFRQTTGEAFVAEVLRGGYCPDKNYLSHINAIIQRHGLYDLDVIEKPNSRSIRAPQTPEPKPVNETVQVGMVP